MKRIGIDARLYSKTGVGVYIRNLIHFLEKSSPDDIEFYIYVLQEEAESIQFTSANFVKRPVPFLWHSFSEQTGFLNVLNADNLDLMHFTYFSYPIFYRKKFIATLHDTILLEHKTGKASTKNRLIYELKHFFFRYVIQSQLQNAQAIITPTHTVKQSIIKLFGYSYADKIIPIYEGVNYALQSVQENKSLETQFPDPFFIYVGNFYPHKNVETLVEAFSKTKTDVKLILIGPEDFFSERVRELIQRLNQSDRIVLFHTFSLENLVFFYKHAKALIHPSRSEGFGLPLVEAAYFGLPIIASDIEVFRELLGDQFIRFNPQDSEDIKSKIDTFIHYKKTLNYSEILNKYSFEEMSKEILSLYKKLL